MMEKATYFELFSRSLEVVTGEPGLYRCPLCLSPSSIAEAESLTWDHYPPKGIGGRDCDAVLVCEACRSRWNQIDAELVPLMKRDEFDQSHPNMKPIVLSIPGQPCVRGLRHREAIGAHNGAVLLMGLPERNAEQATQRLQQFLEQFAPEGRLDGLKINVSIDPSQVYSGVSVARSFLKAAYLAVFDCLGYPYILSTALESLRLQMREPQVAHLDRFALVFSSQPPGFDRQIVLGYVNAPEPLISLAVFFLGYNLTRGCAVLLPLPARPGFPQYGRLEDAFREAGYLNFVSLDRWQGLVTDTELVLVDEVGKEWPVYQARVI